MNKRHPGLAGLLATLALPTLASCASSPATPQSFCAAQAHRDPAVKALVIQSVSNTSFHNQPELDAAVAAATEACLRRQGIPPKRGGVEAPAVPRGDTLFTF